MTLEYRIRQFQFTSDYNRVLALWQSIEIGMHVGPSDTPAEIQKKLQRDPDLFLIAEQNGHIIGTIIGGFDGRRGMIYHLAVHNTLRRQGIGQALLTQVEERLKAKGCLKCLLLVLDDNEGAKHFYEECGWNMIPEDRVFAKMLT